MREAGITQREARLWNQSAWTHIYASSAVNSCAILEVTVSILTWVGRVKRVTVCGVLTTKPSAYTGSISVCSWKLNSTIPAVEMGRWGRDQGTCLKSHNRLYRMSPCNHYTRHDSFWQKGGLSLNIRKHHIKNQWTSLIIHPYNGVLCKYKGLRNTVGKGQATKQMQIRSPLCIIYMPRYV